MPGRSASLATTAVAVAAAVVAGMGVVRVATWPSAAPSRPVARQDDLLDRAPTASPSGSPSAAPRKSPARPRRPAAVRPTTLFPLPAPPALPQPCPPPSRGPRPPYRGWRPPATVPDHELPAPLAPPARLTAPLGAVVGKGMWVNQWSQTEGGDVGVVVRRAKALGLTQVWVRSGSSRQGFYAGPLLARLLPAAHQAGLKVVVWDFPYLHDPVADAERAVETIRFRAPGGHRIDGFSPDIETAGENVVSTDLRVRVYLGLVRRAAGSMPVVATVPRVSAKRLAGGYPYAAMAPYVDAYAAMVYWSCNEPGALAVESVRELSKWRPVHLIGQAYDMASEGGRRGDPTPREIWRFTDAGRRAGAVGVSLYVWQTATRGQLAALAAYPWR